MLLNQFQQNFLKRFFISSSAIMPKMLFMSVVLNIVVVVLNITLYLPKEREGLVSCHFQLFSQNISSHYNKWPVSSSLYHVVTHLCSFISVFSRHFRACFLLTLLCNATSTCACLCSASSPFPPLSLFLPLSLI